MKSSWGALPVLSLMWMALGVAPLASGAIIVTGFPAKIQDAVDLALSNADPADIIRVLPGTYSEHVVIDFTGTNQTILNLEGTGNGNHVITDGVEVVDARLVTLFNFTVDSNHGDGDAAIFVDNTVGFAALSCRGVAGDDGGLDVEDTFEIIVSNCIFSGMNESVAADSGYGVRIRGRTDHEVKNSTFSSNEFRAIWIEADRSRVQSCVAQQTGPGATTDAVFVSGFQNLVRKCKIRDNDGDGLVVSGVCVVRDNTIEDNQRVGMRLGIDGATTFSGGQVRKNTIRDNGSVGLFVDDDQIGAEIRENGIRNNESCGIQLLGGNHLLYKNSVRETSNGAVGGHGIFIDATSDGNNLEGNSVRDNAGQGIRVEGDRNYLTFNTAKGNDGIDEDPAASGNAGRGNKTSGGTNDFP
ncbi:MAG: right-handed parallel beta-helix repeat-containing protein [Planctomycetes bacterium]|nr:right-handed parallel beta-helix repeat-containing protein [Planctomycetota bacterium]MCC7169857.1 right-handed parallel beta-helix repeat-containing protein [Planctomycetota bacterium]